jgi:UrcA family protein
MLTSSSLKSPLRIALLAGAIGLTFTATALAQEYDRYGNRVVYQDNSAPDEITVYAPRHHQERSAIGAPIEEVSLSQPVRYDDLDLTNDRGIHRFHERIAATAREICRRLETRYPVDIADGQPSCYRSAMESAEPLAMAAIDRANGGTYDNRRDDPYDRHDNGDNY